MTYQARDRVCKICVIMVHGVHVLWEKLDVTVCENSLTFQNKIIPDVLVDVI